MYLSSSAAHKESFLKDGVVDVAMESLRQSTQAHVQFKAMSILRLLTEKQGSSHMIQTSCHMITEYPLHCTAATCSHIVSVDGTISRICELCSAIGPVHMQLEGSRLCAAVVKNCSDSGKYMKE